MHETAEKLFCHVTGFSDSNRMLALREAGFAVRDALMVKIQPRAVLGIHKEFKLGKGVLEIAGKRAVCREFEVIKQESVQGVFSYVLTIGDINIPGDLMDELYADYWGTAYAEAALDALHSKLTEFTASEFGCAFVSESFGPGLRRMGLPAVETVFTLADGGRIGVEYGSSFMMTPRKSLCGFIFALDHEPGGGDSCMECTASKTGCNLCHVRRKKDI
ncbi:MAG: hypothetical protein FWE91_06720 [Defluviitaleaceae bacterium]|nr:hypothetical protein [Defluviitaleaceae bacterium]